jgi:hypothetical protein
MIALPSSLFALPSVLLGQQYFLLNLTYTLCLRRLYS